MTYKFNISRNRNKNSSSKPKILFHWITLNLHKSVIIKTLLRSGRVKNDHPGERFA
jgi:hypothetical protein